MRLVGVSWTRPQSGRTAGCQRRAILIMAASIRAGQSWDLRLPYASLRVALRVGTQKHPTFMHLLTGLRLQHPPRGSNSHFGGMKASESWSDQVIGTRAERRMRLFLSTNRRDYAG